MKAIFVGGKLNGLEMDVEEIMNSGLWNRKVTPNYSEARKYFLGVPRKELDNQPLVDGYLSPMWDGGMLRYETQEVYDMLSD